MEGFIDHRMFKECSFFRQGSSLLWLRDEIEYAKLLEIFPARDMFWTGELIKYDKLLKLFPARKMFWAGERIKYDILLELISSRDMFWTGGWIKYDKLFLDFQLETCSGQMSG